MTGFLSWGPEREPANVARTHDVTPGMASGYSRRMASRTASHHRARVELSVNPTTDAYRIFPDSSRSVEPSRPSITFEGGAAHALPSRLCTVTSERIIPDGSCTSAKPSSVDPGLETDLHERMRIEPE